MEAEYSLPGKTYIEQLQKVQLLTLLLREKVRDPSYMEPILARWYQLEMNHEAHGWGYDFMEVGIEGDATGFLMGKGVHPDSSFSMVLIFAYGGAAEKWERSNGGGVGSVYYKGKDICRAPLNTTVKIPPAVWFRASVLL